MRLVTAFTCKSWERYGIHALEGLYQITGPGFVSVRNVGTVERNIVLLRHKRGTECTIYAYNDAYGGFGAYQMFGTKGYRTCKFVDTFTAFKTQLAAFVEYVRTGRHPFPPEETFEMMRIIIAGIRSRDKGGREVELASIGG